MDAATVLHYLRYVLDFFGILFICILLFMSGTRA